MVSLTSAAAIAERVSKHAHVMLRGRGQKGVKLSNSWFPFSSSTFSLRARRPLYVGRMSPCNLQSPSRETSYRCARRRLWLNDSSERAKGAPTRRRFSSLYAVAPSPRSSLQAGQGDQAAASYAAGRASACRICVAYGPKWLPTAHQASAFSCYSHPPAAHSCFEWLELMPEGSPPWY